MIWYPVAKFSLHLGLASRLMTVMRSLVNTQYEAGPEARLLDLRGPVVPALRKLTINSNVPLNNVIALGESTGAQGVG